MIKTKVILVSILLFPGVVFTGQEKSSEWNSYHSELRGFCSVHYGDKNKRYYFHSIEEDEDGSKIIICKPAYVWSSKEKKMVHAYRPKKFITTMGLVAPEKEKVEDEIAIYD